MNAILHTIFFLIGRGMTFGFLAIYLVFTTWSKLGSSSFGIFYHQEWYPRLWKLGSSIFGVLPFPSLYLVAGFLIGWLIYGIYVLFDHSAWAGIKLIVYCLVFTVTSFYVCWGFNYQLPAFVARIGLEVDRPTPEWIQSQLTDQVGRLSALRSQLAPPREIDYEILQQDLEVALNNYIGKLNSDFDLQQYRYPESSAMIVHPLPRGALLRLETSGVYLSQTFQGHLDGGLSHIQIPFTMAHEMLHGYGITEESDCNLIAYLACRESEVPWIAYSAELAFFRYLAFDQIAIDREAYYSFRESLPQVIIDDLNDINEHLRQFPPLLGPIKDRIYGYYLKSNGISDGIANYSFFIKVLYTLESREQHIK